MNTSVFFSRLFLFLCWLASASATIAEEPIDPLALNFHLMHPGGDSKPGDPNAAFHLDGTYHLHYILVHPWTVDEKTRKGFSFVHVTSPDMLHWTWQKTKLQPSFTGHGMYSGTGFMTKKGVPAAIYHGAGSRRNQIAIAKDRQLSTWEKPYPVEPKTADGEDVELRIFIDKFLVEVFAGGRQAMVAADMDWQTASGFEAYTWGAPTTIKKVEIWKVKPTNRGYLEARENRIWEPDTE